MRGSSVLVLRRPDQFSDLLTSNGLSVINLPLTGTRPLDDRSELYARITEIDHYDGCFFTSPVAAEIFVNAILDQDRVFAGKIYVLGERARDVFENKGFEVEFRAGANTAREFVLAFPTEEFSGKTFLFIRGERSLGTVPEMLSGNSVVDEVEVYSTFDLEPEATTVREIKDRFNDRGIEWVCFFAPSAVDSFIRVFKLSELNGIKTAVIGETTGRRVKELGFAVDFISATASSAAFAAGLIHHINNIE